eukprot:4037787-Pleurochrysis_carterae.AAC.1
MHALVRVLVRVHVRASKINPPRHSSSDCAFSQIATRSDSFRDKVGARHDLEARSQQSRPDLATILPRCRTSATCAESEATSAV